VGHYFTGAAGTGRRNQEKPLAEVWNGKSWRIVPAPDPSGNQSQLEQVSCVSRAAFCIAVGHYYSPNQLQVVTLSESWNGARWTVLATPNPAGSSDSELYGVSCSSRSNCTAAGVGLHIISGSPLVYTNPKIVEHWNGWRWKIQKISDPPGTQNAFLYAVSCPTAHACIAAGSYNKQGDGSFARPLVDRLDGGRWHAETPPIPGYSNSPLEDISCASPTACTAVGSYSDRTGRERLLAIRRSTA
jgi:hypothetical protein